MNEQHAGRAADCAAPMTTAADIIGRDATFAQWARGKGYDGFCPFGPVIASGIDPAKLVVLTILNGEERQSYPISDMIFSAQQLVSNVARCRTLVIAPYVEQVAFTARSPDDPPTFSWHGRDVLAR